MEDVHRDIATRQDTSGDNFVMVLEEVLGRPISGNPAERIEALKRRLAHLEDQRPEFHSVYMHYN